MTDICQNLTLSIIPLPFPFTAPNLPTLAINIPPTIDIQFPTCCAYTIPGFNYSPTLPIPGIALLLSAYYATLNSILEPAYAALDQFHVPICNL